MRSLTRMVSLLAAYRPAVREPKGLFLVSNPEGRTLRRHRGNDPRQCGASVPGGLRRRLARGPIWPGVYVGPEARAQGERALLRECDYPGKVEAQFNTLIGMTHGWTVLPRNHFRMER